MAICRVDPAWVCVSVCGKEYTFIAIADDVEVIAEQTFRQKHTSHCRLLNTWNIRIQIRAHGKGGSLSNNSRRARF